jgi:membrane protein EpsK
MHNKVLKRIENQGGNASRTPNPNAGIDEARLPAASSHAKQGSSSKISSARRGFLVNVTSNIVLMLIQSLVSLWFTPYLIKHLGIAVYGMIPLANMITSYLEVITSSFSAAVSRFLTIDLELGDAQSANRTFNTALFGITGGILALSPIVVLIAIAFPLLFNVPSGWESDASWLFASVATAFFISVFAGIFAVSSFVHSKFFLRNVVRILAIIVRISSVVTLFSLFLPRLWFVGVGLLATSLVALGGDLWLWRKLTPELSVRVTMFDRSQLRSLAGMGWWVVLNRIGAMLLTRTDLVVVNTFFGAAMTGGYGSILTFSVLIDSSASVITTVISPIIVRMFARKDFVGLQRLCSQSIKLLGLALALPVGLLCGFSRPILSVWLGPSFQDLSILLVFLVGHLSLNLSALPMRYIHRAYNKIRWPGIMTLLAGAVNLGLSVLVAMWGGWGVVGVAIVGAIVWTAQDVLFISIYTARIMKRPWWTFLPSLSASIIGTILVALLGYGLTLLWMPDGWLDLASSAAIVSLVYVLGVWKIGLSRADWKLLRALMPEQLVWILDLIP